MLGWQRGRWGLAAVLVVLGLIEILALQSKSLGTIVIGVVAGLAAILVLAGANVGKIGLAAAYLCAFTLTWNGWFVGPVRPGDVLILITLVLLLVANPNEAFRTPPWWVKQLALMIILVALLTIFHPPDPLYLAHRTVLDARGRPTVDTKGAVSMAILGVAFKFVVAVLATPMAFMGATLVDRRAPRRLGIAFAIGSAASGWAATVDHFGLDVGKLITKIPDNLSTRQLGFSYHPNFLAAGCVLGISFAFWLLASTVRFEQIVGLVCLVGLLGGIYASGSRGGAVCAIAVVAVCVVLNPRTRPYTPGIFLAGIVVLGIIAGIVPSVGSAILKATRLAGGISTEGSDQVRALLGAQGVRDFRQSPIDGIGLQASFDASEVYLQELASGGLLLFLAMQIYMLGAIGTAWRYLKRYDMAMAVLGSLIGILGLNFFEADLTDRFYYVPAAILVAMVHTLDAEDREADEAPDTGAGPEYERDDQLVAARR